MYLTTGVAKGRVPKFEILIKPNKSQKGAKFSRSLRSLEFYLSEILSK